MLPDKNYCHTPEEQEEQQNQFATRRVVREQHTDGFGSHVRRGGGSTVSDEALRQAIRNRMSIDDPFAGMTVDQEYDKKIWSPQREQYRKANPGWADEGKQRRR